MTRSGRLTALSIAAGLAAIATWWAWAAFRPGSGPDATASQQAVGRGAGPLTRVVLVTIDTLRADHVGIYGYGRAATPSIDGVARSGVVFLNAYAPAPITLPSHASILTGLNPPAHGARHNGMRLREGLPTIASALSSRGFATAAFVSAFPLERRFGLSRGFSTYDDVLPRGVDGRPLNERPGSVSVDAAIAWLTAHRDAPFFLWVHLFEPHAPYGNVSADSPPRPPIERYDGEIATADREVGRLLNALGPLRAQTLLVITADHGEAFGEHEEVTHSLFVYDTTLRVPLVIAGPDVPDDGRRIDALVGLIDIAPTIMHLLGQSGFDADGVDLSRIISGENAGSENRALYAESMAPLLDFGWSPLRSVRERRWKYIDAPRPELYDLASDSSEERNLAVAQPAEAARLLAQVARFGPLAGTATSSAPADGEAASRLAALGYVSAGGQSATDRPDPKDRRAIAARLGAIAAGDLSDDRTVAALEAVLREDVDNAQAHLRLGVALANRGNCAAAVPHLRHAVAANMPTADPYLSLALCLREKGDLSGSLQALVQASRVEPENPVVEANLGMLAFDEGQLEEATKHLRAALEHDPDLHQARFTLARALARLGQRDAARAEAEVLRDRLPTAAPQRSEVDRLLKALQ